jgi:hypothetical protein
MKALAGKTTTRQLQILKKCCRLIKFQNLLWHIAPSIQLLYILSVENLPTLKAGSIYNGFTLAMPPAINNGVDGNGSKVYKG